MTSPNPPKPPTPPWRRTALRVVRFALLLYLAWGVTLFFLQPKLLYLPALAGRGADEADIAWLEKRDSLVRHCIERDCARD